MIKPRCVVCIDSGIGSVKRLIIILFRNFKFYSYCNFVAFCGIELSAHCSAAVSGRCRKAQVGNQVSVCRVAVSGAESVYHITVIIDAVLSRLYVYVIGRVFACPVSAGVLLVCTYFEVEIRVGKVVDLSAF